MIVDKGLTQPLEELWTLETPAKLSQIRGSPIAQLVKNLAAMHLIPGLGRSTGEGIGHPLQYSQASLVAQLVKNLLQCGRPGFDPCVGKIPWRRERLPTPVFWPGEFHGLCSPWGRKELDMTERLFTFTFFQGKRTMLCTPDQAVMGTPGQPVAGTGKGRYSWVRKHRSAEFHPQRWISGISHHQPTLPASGKMSVLLKGQI